jgi:hypothetical protein
LFLAPDVAGEKKALRDAEVKAEKNNVHVDAPWPYDSLDDAAQHVAESLAEILPRE